MIHFKLLPIYIITVAFLFWACQKGEEFTYQPENVKAVSSHTPSTFNRNGATLVGQVHTNNKSPLTQVGFEYGISSEASSLSSQAIRNGKQDTGFFSLEITDLVPRTTYYYRAYAKNAKGTAYGEIMSFITANGSTAAITTNEVTDIGRATATIGAFISDNGGYKVTQRGICYSNTKGMPTISDLRVEVTEDINTFTAKLTNLWASTKYYARSYTVNSYGTSYGNVVSFTTGQAILPTGVSTSHPGSVTSTTAIMNGQAANDNDSPITARGFCYSSSSTLPSLSNSTTVQSGTGTGSFTSNVTNLSASTTYYVRSYATNAAGTAYGNVLTFTTLMPDLPSAIAVSNVTNILANSALCSASIGNAGGGTITSRGICYSKTSSQPSFSNSTVLNGGTGTGTGTFNISISGLEPSTTYYVRAYATNQSGTAYSSVFTFRTSLPSLPSGLSVGTASSITTTSALLGASVTNAGGGTIVQRGIVLSASTSTPTISNGLIITSGSGTGSFNVTASSLNSSTKYYYRAYATNEAGTSYSTVSNFSTATPTLPTGLSTSAAANVTGSTALIRGAISSDGGSAVTARGFVYSSSTSSPTISNGVRIQSGSGIGSFESTLSGLTRNTYYYVRSYATNGVGTSYGSVVYFKTSL